MPARTGFGVPVFVTAKSAWPAVATTTVAVAELLEGFGSVVLEETVAVSLMSVPDAVAGLTVTVTLNVVDAPGAKDGMLHAIDVREHVQPLVPDVGTTETNVVFVGVAELQVTVLALAGPALATTMV